VYKIYVLNIALHTGSHGLISMEARVSFGEEILVLDFKRRKEKDMR
jgi:hypothetical protein